MTTRTPKLLSLLVLAGLLTTLAAAPAAAQTPPFDRTVIVGGSLSPVANGTALLTALAGITTASAADPWKILVEPGIFDLQGSTLNMKNFIDIQGSGRDVTYIRSFASEAVLASGIINAELRDLTVQSFADAPSIAVRADSDDFLLTQVNLEAVSASSATAFLTKGANPRVSEVFARVASEQGTAVGFAIVGGAPVISEAFALIETAADNGIGFQVTDGSTATLLEVRSQIFGVGSSAFGLQISESRINVQNCNLSVRGTNGSVENRGIYLLDNAFASIKDCIASASAGNRPAGLWVSTGSTAEANESIFTGSGGISFAGSYGLFNANGGTAQLDRCTVEGGTAVRNFSPTDVAVLGASRLVGGLAIAAGSTISCAQSYNGANADVNALCL
ncbi:MAG: hypothetical protein AAGN66_19850 [Acidobacteriota bacterium]